MGSYKNTNDERSRQAENHSKAMMARSLLRHAGSTKSAREIADAYRKSLDDASDCMNQQDDCKEVRLEKRRIAQYKSMLRIEMKRLNNFIPTGADA